MEIKIVRNKISSVELNELARTGYGDMVKGVADVKRMVIALGGELHADSEAALLDDGSASNDLWGFNLYPEKPLSERVEFTSLINIKPTLGNRSMDVQDPKIQNQIRLAINKSVSEK